MDCGTDPPRLPTMNSRILPPISALLATAMLAGCANIKNDQTRTKTEGALGGAVIGAAVGFVVGGPRGAAVGAVTGGIGGLGVGSHVAAKKRGYMGRETSLRSAIDRARVIHDAAVRYNNDLTARIADLERRISAARSGNPGDLGRLKNEVLSLRQDTQQQIQRVESEIQNQHAASLQSGDMTLRVKVDELRSAQSSLQQSELKLADLLRRLDV